MHDSPINAEQYRNKKMREEACSFLPKKILQCCLHYQGASAKSRNPVTNQLYHQHCSPKSRCHTDPMYVNSKDLLTPQEADLLKKTLNTCSFMTNTEKYLFGLNTSNVEAYHRCQNVYRDKSNHLVRDEYDMRINLSCISYNENTKGKYKNGKRADSLELSESGVRKRKMATNHFAPDILTEYLHRISKKFKAAATEQEGELELSSRDGQSFPPGGNC